MRLIYMRSKTEPLVQTHRGGQLRAFRGEVCWCRRRCKFSKLWTDTSPLRFRVGGTQTVKNQGRQSTMPRSCCSELYVNGERVDFTRDGFGPLNFHFNVEKTQRHAQRIKEDVECFEMSQTFTIGRFMQKVRKNLNNRPLHGGRMAFDEIRAIMARERTCVKTWARMLSEPFNLDTKKLYNGFPKMGTEDLWWHRNGFLFMNGKRELYQSFYTQLIFYFDADTELLYVKWEQTLQRAVFGTHWINSY
ncbi:hypothetical protein PROFUN_14561 [Planoprotostelium fungivorum]|uniref:Uncharacterized protein n=1 Tax=Planoprotostelium fungivorum TaxID=1890364 RepID=A0A2P6MZ94_9EUKA|nr:hypothetical protein PROFUN_14561 [Planoprotostelium fungivorum]